jgi:hypothetical protein
MGDGCPWVLAVVLCAAVSACVDMVLPGEKDRGTGVGVFLPNSSVLLKSMKKPRWSDLILWLKGS